METRLVIITEWGKKSHSPTGNFKDPSHISRGMSPLTQSHQQFEN